MRVLRNSLLLLAGMVSMTHAAPSIENTRFFHEPGSEITVYYGEVDLASEDGWKAVPGPIEGDPRTVHLIFPPGRTRPNDPAPTRRILVATRKATASGSMPIVLKSNRTGEVLTLEWDVSEAREDPDTVRPALNTARKRRWRPYTMAAGSAVLDAWLASVGATPDRDRRSGGPRGRMASPFSVLGGRAAVRETLQMQALNPRNGDDPGPAVPIIDIQGVEVPAHPFEEMLAGAEGGRLAIADAIPHNRFFLYAARPGAVLPFLDDGARFISRLGAGITGHALRYNLKARYLARLGLDESWLRSFLESGAVSDLAFFTPDLFFIDGTDLTVVARLRQPRLLAGLLDMIGVKGLSSSESVVRTLPDGAEVFWALRDDLLFLSTSEAELSSALALVNGEGEGSLGQSHEFRYMLYQLPPDDATRLFAYLSDPFIRRLVGPEVKIGQLRRLNARADMERIVAAGLLARLDGLISPDLATLIRHGYVPERFGSGAYHVGADLRVRSETYGPLTAMKPISQVPIETVSPSEADAYKTYLEGYQRFWRRYFDPIAIRVNDTEEGGLAAETFILPLIDNTIYNGLRRGLATAETQTPLRIPDIEPKPVLMFSMNFREAAWHEGVTEMIDDMIGRHSTIDPALVTDLRPRLHLAIHDADPVIALGSGDLLGAFGGNMIARGSEMMAVPILLSVLTRPCTLIVETADPGRTVRLLDQASAAFLGGRRRDLWVGVPDFYRIEGKDAWVYALDVMGVVKLRYGIEVRENYVLIRNIPWSDAGAVTGESTASLNGARLIVHPRANRLGLPALATTAGEKARKAALESMGILYPLIACGYADLADAPAAHERLLGFRPLHPGPGGWEWKDGHIGSTVYGTVFRQKQPATPADAAALLSEIEILSVEMQFESDGLRSVVRWRMAE
jgi:hypothetical protein